MRRSRASAIAAITSSGRRSRPSSASSRRIAAPPRASPSATAPMRSSSRCARSASARATRWRRSRTRAATRRRRSAPSGATPIYVDIDDATLLHGPRAARARDHAANARGHRHASLRTARRCRRHRANRERARRRADRGLRAGARRRARRQDGGHVRRDRLLQLLSDEESRRTGRCRRARHERSRRLPRD